MAKKKEAVREASRRFYAALNQMANGDSSAMADIWSTKKKVTAMHPVGARDVGWDAVDASFAQVAQAAADGAVELRDQMIRVGGNMAYETGVEKGHFTFAGELVSFEIRVTNVYQREAGEWKMVHHHTDLSSEMLDRLSRM
jgi:ketosteroid isomerase-like protein